MTSIIYNGNDVFSGNAPTPFVARTETPLRFGERWGILETFILNGTLTGACGSLFSLTSAQKNVVSGFSKDYQSFSILENGSTIFSRPFAKINNISFPTSRYVGIVPFTIEILCYPQDFFTGTYGIIDPKNEINFEEKKDGTVVINHTVSAKGFCTNASYANALENARNFVQGLTGWTNAILPNFIGICSGIRPVLITQSEDVDRLNGSYTVKESYIADPRYSGSGILRYSSTISSGYQNGLTTVALKGDVIGSKTDNISIIENRFNSFDFFSAAANAYSGIMNQIDMNPFPLTSGVTEDPFAKKISFDISFDNDKSPNIWFDYRSSLSTDPLSTISTIRFDGTIKGRGDLRTRWQNVQNFYSGLNVFSYVLQEYNTYGLQYALNPIPTSSGVSFNQFIAEIGVNGTWTNKQVPPSGLDVFTYTMAFTPSTEKFASYPILDATGRYYVVDLGYANRAALDIKGHAIINPSLTETSGIAIVRAQLNYLSSQYATGTRKVLEIDDLTVTNGTTSQSVDFEASFSFEDDKFTI